MSQHGVVGTFHCCTRGNSVAINVEALTKETPKRVSEADIKKNSLSTLNKVMLEEFEDC